ncbi:MAG TPA: cytochrome c peroxidase [Casimicrobiaceae bacterium]|nr:cytochrome c peroxidase [Casimicrobiaceae bacterium]
MARGKRLAAVVAGCSTVACWLTFAQSTGPGNTAVLGLSVPRFTSVSNADLVGLGRALFQDKRLSRDGTVSCASCHDPTLAFTDGRVVATGVGGARGTRNAPTLLNVTYQQSLFWDGRRSTLEAQAADPFFNPRELGLADPAELISKLTADAVYREAFQTIFGETSKEPTLAQVTQALAAFERTLLAADSPFDRYYYAHEKRALSESARRGLEVFQSAARCSQCHTIGTADALFTDGHFHGGVGLKGIATRLAQLTRQAASLSATQVSELVTVDLELAALGRFLVTKDPQDIGKYKTPSLRNVALTAPYMHDGSLATLREAVEYEIYYRSIELGRPLVVTPSERDDLVAFLQALTSPCVAQHNCPGM